MSARTHVAAFDPDGSRRDVTFTVRDARTNGPDADSAARLVAGVYGGDRDAWRDRLTRAVSGRDSLFVVAEVDGAVVGYGKAGHRTPVDRADQAPVGHYLTGLVVAPAWRRCGIGEALTRWRLQHLHADAHPVHFFTNVRNRASLALHEGLGFGEVGRAGSYLGVSFDGGTGVLLRSDPGREVVRAESGPGAAAIPLAGRFG